MIPKIQKINVNYKFIHNTLQLQNYKDKKNAPEFIPEAFIENIGKQLQFTLIATE